MALNGSYYKKNLVSSDTEWLDIRSDINVWRKEVLRRSAACHLTRG